MSTTLDQKTRISLTRLKVAEFASEETLCFSAVVQFDGIPIADAHNDGHGGCTFIHSRRGAEALTKEADAYARSLPPLVFDSDDSSQKLTIEVTLDVLVDEIASELHTQSRLRKAFNRDIANKVLYVADERLLFLRGVALKTVTDRAALFAKVRAKHAGVVILNELPLEQAFALWKRHVAPV